MKEKILSFNEKLFTFWRGSQTKNNAENDEYYKQLLYCYKLNKQQQLSLS